MSSRLSVIFYVILCFEIGIVLTVLPWVPHGWWGLSDWGNNYFLLVASRKVGFGIQHFVASGWVRGAVSGIGILNLGGWRSCSPFTDSSALTRRALVKSRHRKWHSDAPSHVENLSRPILLSDYPRRNH